MQNKTGVLITPFCTLCDCKLKIHQITSLKSLIIAIISTLSFTNVFPNLSLNFCSEGKNNTVLLKKEVGKFDNKICHLVCDFNFHEFRNKPLLHPSPPILPPPPTTDHKAYIYTQQPTNFLGAHESLESK
jgi:hypothetical protein